MPRLSADLNKRAAFHLDEKLFDLVEEVEDLEKTLDKINELPTWLDVILKDAGVEDPLKNDIVLQFTDLLVNNLGDN